MSEVTTIGLDIAKSVFQVHGVDASGETVMRRQRTSTLAAAGSAAGKIARAESDGAADSGTRRRVGQRYADKRHQGHQQ